jgi:hypothetical protein
MVGRDQNRSYGDRLRGVECIHLAEDRDRWRDLVNLKMNLQVLVPRS